MFGPDPAEIGRVAITNNVNRGVSMTKSERLMFLINMLRTRRALSIPQMCASCEVSERTIYRDLCSLSRMNIPVYYDKEYRLAHRVAFPDIDLSLQDLELLCYCLRHHPLTEHAFFARRFRLIERKIRERIHSQTGNDHTGICVLDGPDQEPTEAAVEYKHVARFLTALFESVLVAVQPTDVSPSHLWYPVALRIRHNLPLIVVTESLENAPVELPASGITRIRRTPQRINPQALEQYRRRWLTSSAQEHQSPRDDPR